MVDSLPADVALVVDEEDLTELIGTWKTTARGHPPLYEGRLGIPIEHRDTSAVMARVLSRLRKEDVEDGEKDS